MLGGGGGVVGCKDDSPRGIGPVEGPANILVVIQELLVTLFLSDLISNASESPVGSIFKIYPECNHFSPHSLPPPWSNMPPSCAWNTAVAPTGPCASALAFLLPILNTKPWIILQNCNSNHVTPLLKTIWWIFISLKKKIVKTPHHEQWSARLCVICPAYLLSFLTLSPELPPSPAPIQLYWIFCCSSNHRYTPASGPLHWFCFIGNLLPLIGVCLAASCPSHFKCAFLLRPTLASYLI